MSGEKHPPRAQIFRYFRIESRNNKKIGKKNYEKKNRNQDDSFQLNWISLSVISRLLCKQNAYVFDLLTSFCSHKKINMFDFNGLKLILLVNKTLPYDAFQYVAIDRFFMRKTTKIKWIRIRLSHNCTSITAKRFFLWAFFLFKLDLVFNYKTYAQIKIQFSQ